MTRCISIPTVVDLLYYDPRDGATCAHVYVCGQDFSEKNLEITELELWTM